MSRFSFEKFTQIGGSFSPIISVRKDGALGVSQGALRKYGLMEGDWFVILYFDKSMNTVGIKPTQDSEEEGAIKLVKRQAPGKGGQPSISASVSARAFLEFYGIDRTKTQSYRAELDAESGLIFIDLNKSETPDDSERKEEPEEVP